VRLVGRLRLVVVLAVALTLASCTSPSEPATATNPVLFYARGGSLYVSDLNGAPPRRLTDGPGDTQPAPSPDGKRVAFVRRPVPDEPGGELWVLDLDSGASRRLVDPAALVPRFDADRPGVEYPRWSPTGERIAFLKATFGGGGFLLTAAADSGMVLAPDKPLFADPDYAWSPDGSRIAWSGGRSDVRPVDVAVLTVGGSSNAVATDTNAVSVSFDTDGRSVLFANGDATGSAATSIPFALRDGGIYAVDPGASPAPLLTGPGYYSNLHALRSGEIGFTQSDTDPTDNRSAMVRVLGRDRTPRTIADTWTDAPAPAWSGGWVAYVEKSGQRSLMVRRGAEEPRKVDSGADALAWADQTGG